MLPDAHVPCAWNNPMHGARESGQCMGVRIKPMRMARGLSQDMGRGDEARTWIAGSKPGAWGASQDMEGGERAKTCGVRSKPKCGVWGCLQETGGESTTQNFTVTCATWWPSSHVPALAAIRVSILAQSGTAMVASTLRCAVLPLLAPWLGCSQPVQWSGHAPPVPGRVAMASANHPAVHPGREGVFSVVVVVVVVRSRRTNLEQSNFIVALLRPCGSFEPAAPPACGVAQNVTCRTKMRTVQSGL